MTRFICKAALAIASLSVCAHASAADATATATAEVLAPISITVGANLAFGNVVAGNGDVTVSTSGARTKTGAAAFSTSGASPAAAQFNVSGAGSNTFSIDYTGSTTMLTSSGGATMAIDWVTEAVTGTGTATGKTDASSDATVGTLSSGSARIYAGGKLTVGASQPAGNYTGSLKVTVAYN